MRKTTTLQYLQDDQGLADYVASVAGGEVAEHQGNFYSQKIQIEDARTLSSQPEIDAQGFCLRRHDSAVSDFFDDDQLQEIYEGEILFMINEVFPGSEVRVFDHTRRSTSDQIRKEKKMRQHASVIHNDYTDGSARKRKKEILAREYEKFNKCDFAIVNIWRSINGTVKNFPLALCDAQTVSDSDLIPVARLSKDRRGEIQFAKYHPNHRWYYFSEMNESEVLVFKTYDSRLDGRARQAIHSAFDDAEASPDSPPRESIESRCFVFFKHEPS